MQSNGFRFSLWPKDMSYNLERLCYNLTFVVRKAIAQRHGDYFLGGT